MSKYLLLKGYIFFVKFSRDYVYYRGYIPDKDSSPKNLFTMTLGPVIQLVGRDLSVMKLQCQSQQIEISLFKLETWKKGEQKMPEAIQ